MAKGFFITGTDTGVGKTVIAGAVIRAVRMCGLSACGMKPIETGCVRSGNTLMPSDGPFLKDASGMQEKLNVVTPVRLEHPLAPMVAAEMEGGEVDIEEVMLRFNDLERAYDAVVVEGVGGMYVPIAPGYFVSDLAKSMGLPLIVVCTPFLGTINHTLLTVDKALRAGLEVAGVVINFIRRREGGLAEETNPTVLERLLPVPVVGIMPYLEDLSNEALDRAVSKKISLAVIRKHLGL